MNLRHSILNIVIISALFATALFFCFEFNLFNKHQGTEKHFRPILNGLQCLNHPKQTDAPVLNLTPPEVKFTPHLATRTHNAKMQNREPSLPTQKNIPKKNIPKKGTRAQSKHRAQHSKRLTKNKTPITHRQLQSNQLDEHIFQLAMQAYHHAQTKGLVKKPLITIIDYTKPSNQKRLWVVDLRHHTIPFHTFVAHGKNTGHLKAQHFSNRRGSKASSLGVFVTSNPYFGHKGYSLRLKGLEKGYNSNALARATVIHGAWYAGKQFLQKHQRLGLSWGCPAIDKRLAKPIINTIKNGALLFAYYPNARWLSHSRFLD